MRSSKSSKDVVFLGYLVAKKELLNVFFDYENGLIKLVQQLFISDTIQLLTHDKVLYGCYNCECDAKVDYHCCHAEADSLELRFSSQIKDMPDNYLIKRNDCHSG